MAIYTIGEVLKRERLAQGITQEALADNICSTSWLSKIECGVKTPTPQVFELLMKRLGKNVSQYVVYKSDQEMALSNLKQNINALYRTQNITEGREALKQFVALRDENNPLDLQYELLSKTLFYEDEMSIEEEKEMLIKALNLTLPEFSEAHIPDYLLSSEEIVILNSLGNLYQRNKDFANAIGLLKQLLTYLERPKFDMEEKKKVYPTVAYNIANLSGVIGNYSESVYYAEKGIDFSIQYNVLRTLPKLLYTKGCSLADMGNIEEGSTFLTQAYHLFNVLRLPERAERLKERAKKDWHLDIY